MSVFNTEKYMRYRNVVSGVTISDERRCTKCGYNLYGLKSNSRCPECGTPIFCTLLGESKSYSLTYVSTSFTRVLSVGINILFFSALFMIFITIITVSTPSKLLPAGISLLSAMLAVTIFWALGCFLLTIKRPDENKLSTFRKSTSNLRVFIRITCFSWLLLSISYLILFYIIPQPVSNVQYHMLAFLIFSFSVIGIISNAALSLYFAILSRWSYDLDLASKFEHMLWGIVFGAVMINSISVVANGVYYFTFSTLFLFFNNLIFAIIWLLAVFYGLQRLWTIRTMLTWVVKNNQSRLAYYKRQSRR